MPPRHLCIRHLLKCPQGTYVYVIYYRRPGTEDIVNQKGTITLIR